MCSIFTPVSMLYLPYSDMSRLCLEQGCQPELDSGSFLDPGHSGSPSRTSQGREGGREERGRRERWGRMRRKKEGAGRERERESKDKPQVMIILRFRSKLSMEEKRFFISHILPTAKSWLLFWGIVFL